MIMFPDSPSGSPPPRLTLIMSIGVSSTSRVRNWALTHSRIRKTERLGCIARGGVGRKLHRSVSEISVQVGENLQPIRSNRLSMWPTGRNWLSFCFHCHAVQVSGVLCQFGQGKCVDRARSHRN